MEEKTITYTKFNKKEIENIEDRTYNIIRQASLNLKDIGSLSEDGLQRIAKVVQEELGYVDKKKKK